jgi:hypothetical protein
VVFVLRAQAKDAVNFNKTVWLYRGISGKTIDMTKFASEGGTELAPMSTSKSFDVATKYRPRPTPPVDFPSNLIPAGDEFNYPGVPHLHKITTRT